eukprot:1334436-Rhodomonas_salina.1
MNRGPGGEQTRTGLVATVASGVGEIGANPGTVNGEGGDLLVGTPFSRNLHLYQETLPQTTDRLRERATEGHGRTKVTIRL